MNRDEAKAAAEWAERHDNALAHWHERIRRREAIRAAFSDHEKPTCSLSVNQRVLNNYGHYIDRQLEIPTHIARDMLMTDIAQQITRARIAAMKAGVDPALLVEHPKKG